MEQVFRIEIPVEAVDKTDTASLQRLESVLQKIFASMKQNKTTANEVFDAIEQGASEARAAMQQTSVAAQTTAESYEEVGDAASEAGNEQSQASGEAASASEKLEDTVSKVSQAYDETGSSAAEAGRKSGSAFTQASSSADKFTQRIEKSSRTLRSMFKEKLQLTMAAIDRASPALKSIASSAKSLTAKAWHVAVRMKDFVTAPFRKLYNMITSPITMALSIVGVGLGAGDVISTFADFKSGMSTVKALTGATDEEFIQLTETAENLGATTKFTATEASEGMKYLAMAGWETSEIIEAMPGLLNLAAAGATDLGTAADIVSDVMTAMGMEAGEASRAADVFAKTATSSNTTIEGLGNTLKYAAPIAHSFGMTLEDVAAAAGLMANAGIKGEMAGTALRASLLRMSSPTSDMTKTMKKLGISFSEESGEMKSMSTIIRSLETAFAGLSQAQRLEYAQTLFGTEAASAWLGLIDQGADAYDKMSQSLYGCAGAAEQMAQTQLDNLAGDMTLLQSAVDGMKISLVDKLDPYLRKGVQWLTGKIPEITQKLSDLIDKGMAKAGELKNFLSGVFNSQEWKSADGFVDKFFIAWDKIIAEPFETWWQGEGQGKVLGALEKLGSGAGELLHGIITGVFAALKGEEVNLEGLNITGLGKAGAEAAKAFVSSFMAAFDLGGLTSEMPGMMKAGLFGFGAIKLGQGGFGIYKTVASLKAAFTGVTAAAGTAAPAVASVGAKAATSAVGIGKASTVLGGLKTALAAVPVWGWVAAAAITAAAVGIKLYTDAQERQRQELLHASDAGAEAAEQYRESARQYAEYSEALNNYKEHKIELETVFKPLSEEDKQTILSTISDLEKERIELETVLADGGLSDTERAKLSAQILEIEADRIALTFTLQEPTQEEKDAIIQQIQMLEEQKIDIQALIDGGGLPEGDIAALKAQIADLEASEICLKAAIEPLTEQEIKLLTDKLDEIEADKIEIQALIDGGGLPPEQVSALEQQIDDLNKKEVLIKATLGNLSDEEIAQYAAQQLGIDYDKLIELSGGQITQADVDAGRVTDERFEQVQQTLAMQAETDLLNLQMEVEKGRATIDAQIEKRAGYESDYQTAQGIQDNLSTARANLIELEAERSNLVAQDELNWQRVQLGTMSMDDYDTWYEETFAPGINSVQDKYESDVAPYALDEYGFPLLSPQAPFFDALLGENALQDWITSLTQSEADAANRTAAAKENYDTQNASLVGQYQNEKALVEGQAFQGSQFAGMSLEEVAAGYSTLDEAGKQMFANAIAGLAQLNEATGYITEDEKVGVQTVLEQAQQSVVVAANAEVMGDVQTKLTAIAASYQGLEGDAAAAFNTENIDAVNTALESLGLDKIESLDQINDALAQIAAIDPSGLDFNAAAASLEALGGSADAAREKVSSTKAQLDALAGTYEVKINITQSGSTSISLPRGAVKKNAAGGIYDGAMLSWVAEDGPEAIIPLGSKRRERGLDLWMQAGKMLGVSEFAEGGILAPYSGAMENLPDDVWDDDDGGGNPTPPAPTGNGGGSGDRTISVNVSANPTFQIEGGNSPDEILAMLKAKQKELAEIFGEAIADQLEDIVSNMV